MGKVPREPASTGRMRGFGVLVDPAVFQEKASLLEGIGHGKESDQSRHLDEVSDHGCKGGTGIDEDRGGRGDGKLEIVAGCGEGKRGGLRSTKQMGRGTAMRTTSKGSRTI